MKDIYILLTKSDTLFSKAIYKITRAEYTHASIALDRELTMLYSFGRKYRYSMLPAGFVHEDINSGVMGASDTMKCALFRIRVSDRCYNKIAGRLRHMEANSGNYRYNIMGIPLLLFLKKILKTLSILPYHCLFSSLFQKKYFVHLLIYKKN